MLPWEARQHLAFVDESGDPSLHVEVQGVSTHFVVAAILVSKAHENELRRQMEAKRQQHFQTGEMKSSSVGQNHDRRTKILRDLCSSNFRLIALAVDKSEIASTGGLIYKRSFLKFLTGVLYNKLYRAYPNLRVFADEHGRRLFMDGFVQYVEREHMPDLFTRAEFEFRESSSDVLVQLADFMAGSVSKVLGPETPAVDSKTFLDAIEPRLVLLEEWPPRLQRFVDRLPREDRSELDDIVASQAVTLAIDFVDKNYKTKDPIKLPQVETVQYLLFEYRYVDAFRSVSTGELLSHLEEVRGERLSRHVFRSGVIAPLRDAGVLITSSSKGYKLPASTGDLVDFVEQTHGIVGPMLTRLRSARNQIRLATRGEFDVLDQPRYAYLRSLLDELLTVGDDDESEDGQRGPVVEP